MKISAFRAGVLLTITSAAAIVAFIFRAQQIEGVTNNPTDGEVALLLLTSLLAGILAGVLVLQIFRLADWLDKKLLTFLDDD